MQNTVASARRSVIAAADWTTVRFHAAAETLISLQTRVNNANTSIVSVFVAH